jgi:hypothetical protein
VEVIEKTNHTNRDARHEECTHEVSTNIATDSSIPYGKGALFTNEQMNADITLTGTTNAMASNSLVLRTSIHLDFV